MTHRDTVPGVQRDLAAGMRYARVGADGGVPAAQLMLGKGYYFGEGLPRDMAQALAWFRKAAANGDAEAQHELATDAGLLAAARGD